MFTIGSSPKIQIPIATKFSLGGALKKERPQLCLGQERLVEVLPSFGTEVVGQVMTVGLVSLA